MHVAADRVLVGAAVQGQEALDTRAACVERCHAFRPGDLAEPRDLEACAVAPEAIAHRVLAVHGSADGMAAGVPSRCNGVRRLLSGCCSSGSKW